MKKYITSIIFLCCLNLNSQVSSGKITYNIQAPDIDTKSNDPKSVMLKKLIIENARNQSFVLEFNKNKSSFKRSMKLNLLSDKEKMIDKITSGLITISYNCFFDQNAENYILQTEDGILVRKPFKSLDWEIFTESKMIDNYLCYKALCYKKNVNMKGEEKNSLVTAWFSPELPYSYGPKEFYGLPGLILELQEGKIIFYATEISIIDLKKEIDFPKGKTITEEEYRRGALVQQY
ncbi:GLPGLI family protein [Flavobacterium sp. FlaQc-48]|uniref:GLPGLI family protein n=1 Tax=Flavobacterium sp. FlaQc-48 TaxID=3374181 RepID=UPI0037563A7F